MSEAEPMKPADATPAPQMAAGTGPWSSQLPSWVKHLPPCNAACPAGENIQAWLGLAQAGNYRAAWETLVQDNPLPAVHGRVCYHPCETSCNREELDSAVSIHAVERFLGDMAAGEGWPCPIDAEPSGKRVLVVGAGPSGLSAAYHLTRLGHSVEIREAGPLAGGMMHFGIPAYRLPREDLTKEVRRIEQMGVRIVLSHKVEELLAEKAEGEFDAEFVAIGAHIGKHIDIPARDAARVLDAVTLLHRAGSGERPRLGRRVAIFGGGDTAMDAARTAKRLGAEEAVIIYHRDRAHMPAHAVEANEALEEGVKIKWLTSIREIGESSLTVEAMELDEDGRPRGTGRLEALDADSVILALGQQTDSAFLRRVPGIEFKPDGTVIVGPDMMTGHEGVFGGGDMVPGERTVTAAVGHGKRAAQHIDAWLRGDSYRKPPKHPPVTFDMLDLPLFLEAPRRREAELPLTERTGFAEVVHGLSEPEARFEAGRCLSCGNCFECDNCYAACPEQAIVRLGRGLGYRVGADLCTGCGICFEECPCHAIEMIAATMPAEAPDGLLGEPIAPHRFKLRE